MDQRRTGRALMSVGAVAILGGCLLALRDLLGDDVTVHTALLHGIAVIPGGVAFAFGSRMRKNGAEGE